ncbi:TLR4 interactor with leucine rich repeats [Latimeria chalumnae]|uniref:TLR4 interactor with leucine rich repeats n=1 Tax=Latimeria chalumnae TaxID=7897 RepID=H3B7A5_LATCH|nr:PREDICTED: TLR4 interactor with leucine rich repeats [Latimeria chalumnae]|eukprot:XP_005994366.1 PREDICTED: TLR4 interactor with leucine rich repeats [Latimeria chalumnae]
MESLWTFWLIAGCCILLVKAICPDRCDCQQYQHLLCTNRGLRTVPKATIQNPQDILTYSLGGNFIANISAFDFHRFSRLLRLDLQYNQIHAIHPKTFEKLSRLEELYLGNNLIASICPGTLNPLRKLRILYVNSNEIRKLNQGSFANLDSLIKLRLDGNSIESLQDALFTRLTNLLYLHLESNKIRFINKNAFANLGKLRFLNLSGNSQTVIRNAATFGHLSSLTTLILSENQIQQVGSRAFQNLQKLTKLSLSSNRIAFLSTDVFKGLSALKELHIDENALTEIPSGLLDPLERLEELNLNNNVISTVHPFAFKELRNLRILKLKGNAIAHLSGEIFASNGGLYSLDLNENNWTCDCRLRGLKEWMNLAHSQGKLLTVFVQCHHPPVLKGKYLDYLNESQLQMSSNGSDPCFFQLEARARQPLPAAAKGVAVLAGQVNIQSDQGGTMEPNKGNSEDRKRKQTPHRLASTDPSLQTEDGTPVFMPQNTVVAEMASELKSIGSSYELGTHLDHLVSFAPSTPLPVQSRAEKHNFLMKDGFEMVQKPLVTDPCEFNKFFILNLTVEGVASNSATIKWTVLEHRNTKHGQVHFRVLFDRFGQSVKFHRFIYVKDKSCSVTLQELKEDTPYLVCIESVIAEQVCQVASRDHCVGLVTAPEKSTAVDYQLLTVILLAVNALLVLMVIAVWLSRALRKKFSRRKTPVHVRQMYSTRRPLRSMSTAVSTDFTGYQSNRSRSAMCTVNEADLIEFPCDRFGDNNLRREDIMQRFSD